MESVMKKICADKDQIDDKLSKTFEEIEKEKEKKLLNLLVEIIVQATLKECDEKSNKIPEI